MELRTRAESRVAGEYVSNIFKEVIWYEKTESHLYHGLHVLCVAH